MQGVLGPYLVAVGKSGRVMHYEAFLSVVHITDGAAVHIATLRTRLDGVPVVVPSNSKARRHILVMRSNGDSIDDRTFKSIKNIWVGRGGIHRKYAAVDAPTLLR